MPLVTPSISNKYLICSQEQFVETIIKGDLEALEKLIYTKEHLLGKGKYCCKIPLHEAARNGHITIVELLLKQGADKGSKNIYGKTSLHEAAFVGYTAIVELLLRQGADIEAKDETSNTPLHDAAFMDNTATVEFLLQQGADIQAQNEYGHTPLHMAAINSCTATVEFLLQHGADKNAKNKKGQTPFQLADNPTIQALLKQQLKKQALPIKKNVPIKVQRVPSLLDDSDEDDLILQPRLLQKRNTIQEQRVKKEEKSAPTKVQTEQARQRQQKAREEARHKTESIENKLPEAQRFLRQNEFKLAEEAAQENYEHFLRLKPNDINALQGLAKAQHKLATIQKKEHIRQQEAERLFVQQQLEKAECLAEEAALYYSQGAYHKAITTISEAIELRPECAIYHYARSLTFYQLNNVKASLQDIQRAIDLDEEAQARYYYQRGLCYQVLQQLSIAIADFQQAIRLELKDVNVYPALGECLMQQKQYVPAIEAFKTAIDLQPKVVSHYQAYVRAQLYAKRYPQSLETVQHALVLYSTDDELNCLQGLLYTTQADYQKAITCFEEVLFQQPQHFNSRFNRGYCYQQLEDYSKACGIYKQLLNDIQPNDSHLKGVILFYRGLGYQAQGKIEKALIDIEAAQTLLQNYPYQLNDKLWLVPSAQRLLADSSDIASRLRKQKKQQQQLQAQQLVAAAQNYLAHEAFDLALQHCEQALALDKRCIEAYWLKGAIWQRQEKWEQASGCFNEVIKLNPHYQGITADLSKVQKKLKTQEERQQHVQWLREKAPHAIIEAVLEGLVKGVAANSEFGLSTPLQGLGEDGAKLDTVVIQQLQKTLLRLLTTSQLLNRYFKPEYQPIVTYKLVEYLFSLFPGAELQAGLFSKRPLMTGALEFKKSISQRDIEKAISQGMASARHHLDVYIKKQEERQANSKESPQQVIPPTFFRQQQPATELPVPRPEVNLQETVMVNTVFGQPLEFATALAALLRSKDQKHAYLVMMRLRESDILEMHSYHFQQHPTDSRYGLVNIGEEKIILSQNDTEQSLYNEQNEVLQDKRFTNSEADFPLHNCHYQVFHMSRTEAIQLHLNVTADFGKSRKKQMPYFKWGNKALANKSLSTVPGHNCYTWAREKLEDIGKKVSHSWIDYIATDPSYHLNDKTCSVM